MYFHGARFSNYEAWLSDPTHIKPSAQVVWPIVGQEILNGDVGGGFQGIQITSGFFQLWRASGITSELQLYTTAIGGLVMAAAMFFAGWFHYHKAAPKLEWFQNVESMLNHHLAGLLGLGSLAWAGHQIHVSLPVNKLLDAGVDPKEIPLPHDLLLNPQIMADLYPSFAKGIAPFFTLNWSEYSDFLTFKGGLNPVTGGLWLRDTAHHHVAIAVLFLVAGHMYRTNWGIGHSIREILEAHRGPFTGEGHVGLYEILTTSWHAQLAINLALFGSLSIIVACRKWVTLNPTICWNIPFAPFKAYPQVLKYFFAQKQLILVFYMQSLVAFFLQTTKNILWENLEGRNNQQETNMILGSSETLRGTFFFFALSAQPFGSLLFVVVFCLWFLQFVFNNPSCQKQYNNTSQMNRETLGTTFNQYHHNSRGQPFGSKDNEKNSVYDFSAYQEIKPTHKKRGFLTPEEIKFLEWFIGFSEGDGSFFLKANRSIFVINQADAYVLNKIRTTLGFGTVQAYNQNGRVFARYTIQGEENVLKLILIFNGNIHLEKVYNRFERWVNHYNTYATQPVLLKPRFNSENLTLNSAWIAGFFDAEGGFYASIGEQLSKKGTKLLRLRLNAYVDQKGEHDVMTQIQTLFGITSLTIRNPEKQYFRVEASTKKPLENILKYFNVYPLKSKKHAVYAMWKKIAIRFIENTHLGSIQSLRPNIEKIKEQNLKFKTEKNAFYFMTLDDETLV